MKINSIFQWKVNDSSLSNLIRTFVWVITAIGLGFLVKAIVNQEMYAEFVSLSFGVLEVLIGVFQYFSSKIDSLLDRQEIIVRLDIFEFDHTHVKVIQELFCDLEKNKDIKEIYVLDNSHYAQWWSGSMLAYLAVQSVWMHNPDRKIHRFFVLKKSDIVQTQTKKLLMMHILMGFETYLILEDKYLDLIKSYNNSNHNKNIIDKEFFIWDYENTNEKNINDDITNIQCVVPSLAKIYGTKPIVGYQSYWNVRTPYYKRKGENPFYNIEGNPINLEKLEVKFEFITSRQVNIRDNYLCFAKYLVGKAKTVTALDEVDAKDIIIHIPLFINDNEQIDKYRIDGILDAFIINL